MPEENTAWFALSVVPRKEKATALALAAKGYEHFLPMYTERRRWSDRIKKVELPLFTGYVFARFDPVKRLPILKMPTVLSVVGLGREPEPILETEIDALQTVCKAGVQAIPHPYITVGAKVRINEGPLTGVEGLLLEEKQSRMVLSITLLQRSVSVEVESEWIAPERIYREYRNES
jgi:transcription antitermination factor NusG